MFNRSQCPLTGKLEAEVVRISRVDYCRCAAAHKDTPVMNKVLLSAEGV